MRIKRVIIGTILLFASVLAGLIALLVSGAISGDRLKPYIADGARDLAGYELTISGPIEYQIWPAPHIKISDIEAKPTKEKSDQKILMSLSKMELYISLVDLLKGQLAVDRLRLEEPKISMSDHYAWKTDAIEQRLKTPKADTSQNKFYQIRNVEVVGGDIKFQNYHVKSLDFKSSYNALLKRLDVTMSLNYEGKSYALKGTLDPQDILQKFLGVDIVGQSEGYELGLKGLVSWGDEGLAYQGETTFSSQAHNISGKALLNVEQNADSQSGYSFNTTDAQLSYKAFDYNLSLSGDFLNQGLLNLDVTLESNTSVDANLQDSLSRILGDLKVLGMLKVDSADVFKSSFDVHTFDTKMKFEAESSNDAMKFVFQAGSLNIDDFIQARQVVAEDTKSFVDLYFEQGQDYFHEMVLGYLKKIPALPKAEWGVSLDQLEYKDYVVNSIEADFSTSGADIEIKRLKAALPEGQNIRIKGKIASDIYDLDASIAGVKQFDGTLDALISGGAETYKWDGKLTAAGETVINFKALQRDSMPKDYVSLLIVNLKSQAWAMALPEDIRNKIYPQVRDFNLNGSANIEAQIGLLNDRTVSIDFLRGTANKTNFDSQAKVQWFNQKPDILAQLKIDNLRYKKRKAAAKTSVQWSRNELKLPVLNKANVKFVAELNKANINGYDIRTLNTKIAAKEGDVRIEELNVDGLGGQISAQGGFVGQDSKRLSLNTNLKGIQTAALLKNISNKKKPLIEGSVDAALKIESKGRSSAALVNALAGEGRLSGAKMQLNGIDIAKIGNALRLDTKLGKNLSAIENAIGKGLNKGTTQFDKVEIPYSIKNGIVTISKGSLIAKDFALLVSGTVSLPNQTMALTNTIKFKGDGTSDIPEVEYTVKGPINAPVKDLTGQVVEQFLKQKLQRKLNKELGNVLEGILGVPSSKDKAPANDNSSEQKKEEAPQKIDPAQLLLRQILGN